jgi:hypothetical protein
MSEKTARIEAEMQAKRDALRSNFDELEAKVKSVTDWRRHFERHPGASMAAALGAGAVLATMVGRQSRRRGEALSSGSAGQFRASAGASASGVREPGGTARAIWDPLRDALIGVAVMRATGFLEQILPGFQEQLKRGRKANGDPSRPSGDHDGSKPMRGEGDAEAGGRYRGDAEELRKPASIERSAREAPPRDQQASAERGASEEMTRKRAQPT